MQGDRSRKPQPDRVADRSPEGSGYRAGPADTAAPHNPDLSAIVVRTPLYTTGNGYLELLGLHRRNTSNLVAEVEKGLSFGNLASLQDKLAIPMDQLADTVRIAPRTLSRRREHGLLTPEESDRLLRLARLVGLAIDLFNGDMALARSWLALPQVALGGQTPMYYARTEIGAREVENLIGRLNHGVFS